MAKRLEKVDQCLNCGASVTNNFCAVCGQEGVDQTVSVKHLFSDFADQLFGLDSKLLKTLKPLVLRPGYLTNEYNVGRRVAFLSPFRLYVFMSLIFFFVVSLQSSGIKTAGREGNARVMAGKTGLIFTDAKRGANLAAESDDSPAILKDAKELPATIEAYTTQQRNLLPEKRDSKVTRFFKYQAIKVNQLGPVVFLQKFIGYVPNMMFCLLPLFALALKMLYRRPRRLYIEHLIFLLHCHAFIFLVFTLMAVLPYLVVNLCLFAATAIYLFVAMKRVYRQSFFTTLFKFALLAINYLFIFSLCLAGTLFVTFLLV